MLRVNFKSMMCCDMRCEMRVRLSCPNEFSRESFFLPESLQGLSGFYFAKKGSVFVNSRYLRFLRQIFGHERM